MFILHKLKPNEEPRVLLQDIYNKVYMVITFDIKENYPKLYIYDMSCVFLEESDNKLMSAIMLSSLPYVPYTEKSNVINGSTVLFDTRDLVTHDDQEHSIATNKWFNRFLMTGLVASILMVWFG